MAGQTPKNSWSRPGRRLTYKGRFEIRDNGRGSSARAWYIWDLQRRAEIVYGDDPEQTPNIRTINDETSLPFFRQRDARSWLETNR